jgi:L-ascorbate metabolism protein UlaG (beta-lactamase superfamily)
MKTSEGLLAGVSHFKQSTVRIEGEKTIYIDPFSCSFLIKL